MNTRGNMDWTTDPLLTRPMLLNGRYCVQELIKTFTKCTVYKGYDLTKRTAVAIKVKKEDDTGELERERNAYLMLKGGIRIPDARWQGEMDRKFFLVMDLLGPSVHDLFIQKRTLTAYEVGCIGEQMIEALVWIHDRGIIHCDMKPSNIALHYGSTTNYQLFDFGACEEYRMSDGTHIASATNVPFKGTDLFCSVNIHDRMQSSRRDDLVSLGYSSVMLLKGCLPWCQANLTEAEIGIKKRNTTVNFLCRNSPAELKDYLTVTTRLGFNENPGYAQLKALLTTDVIAFKEKPSQILKLPPGEFELLYCGLSLRDNRKLNYYGIKSDCTVHAIRKTANEDQKIESIGTDKLKQLRIAAMSIIAHKPRHILEETLKNEDYVENLIAVTPSLGQDVLALGLVQDIEMFIL